MTSPLIESSYKFCPQCGAESSQLGSVPFRCQRCGFAQFFGPVAAVGALISNEGGQLLLVRRACDPGKGRWGLPGGFVDRDETVEQAMAREVREETGLKVVEARYLVSHPNQYCYRGIVAPVIDFFFHCSVDGEDEIKLAADELDHHEWVRPTDAHLQQMAFVSNRLAIERWLTLDL
jgi:ADP-ribose pyrophosphatase YjhB (NUDIX family)